MDRKKLLLIYLGSSSILILLGLLMIFSASSALAHDRFGTPYFFLLRQILFLLVSIISFLFIVAKVDTEHMKKFSFPILVLSLVLLILPLLPKIGYEAGGARRWIRIWCFSFQPSELFKLVFVLYLSSYMSRGKDRIAPPLIILVLSSLLLLKEPDFGSVIFLVILFFLCLFSGGMRLKKFTLPALAFPSVLLILIKSKGYRMERFLGFIDPWRYKSSYGYQLVQSFISFGSGGLFGKGLGCGTEKLFFLPEPHTDFIFAVIGEELGFIGVLGVVVLYWFFFYSGYMLSKLARKRFSSILILNLTMMITLQALIHMCVNLGLLPPKGIPLPFISYGGSSLLINMVSLGIVVRSVLEDEG